MCCCVVVNLFLRSNLKESRVSKRISFFCSFLFQISHRSTSFRIQCIKQRSTHSSVSFFWDCQRTFWMWFSRLMNVFAKNSKSDRNLIFDNLCMFWKIRDMRNQFSDIHMMWDFKRDFKEKTLNVNVLALWSWQRRRRSTNFYIHHIFVDCVRNHIWIVDTIRVSKSQ